MAATDLSGLLAGEFRELGTELEALAPDLAAGAPQAAARCIDLYQRVAQVGELIEAPPLTGFAEFLVANVPALTAGPGVSRLTAWPELVGRCLENTRDEAAWRELVDWLTSPEWHVPLERERALELEEQLKLLVLVEDDKAGETFAPITAEDLELTPGDDATPQAMEAFSREAPQQAAGLSRCLAALADSSEAAERAAEACRLAHTLKGSASLLGVGSIAHLAHALEAALQSRPPEDWLDRPGDLECLQEAGDMTELVIELALSGGSAPDELVDLVDRLRALSGGTPASAPPSDAEPPREIGAKPERWPDTGAAQRPPGEPLAARVAPSRTPAEREAPDETAGDPGSPREEPDAAAAKAPVRPGFGAFEASLAVPVRIVDDNLERANEINLQIARLRNQLATGFSRAEQLEERLQQVQARVHELERFVDTRMTPAEAPSAARPQAPATTAPGDFDPLELDQYNALHSIGGVLAEAVHDSRELARDLREDLRIQEGMLARHGRYARELGGSIMAARLVGVATIVPRLERIVRQTARRLGRKAELVVEHGGLSVDTEILDGLVEPLMHALRNAIDHGIESPEERAASGKPETGRIELEFRRAGNRVEVVCSDDGRGLDLEAIAKRARQLGLIAPSSSVLDNDLIQHVFVTGLSTRRDATEISGRGIGMDSIRNSVERLQGTVQLESRPGFGCTLTLRLPMHLSSTHVLFVTVDDAVFGIPATAVERIVYSDAGQASLIGAEATFSIEDTLCPLHSLAALLGSGGPGASLADLAAIPRPLVVVHGDTGPVALAVDRAVDSRDVAIQPLGPSLPSLPGIAGGCILPGGDIGIVLEIGELLRAPVTRPADPGAAPPQPETQRCCALVVDDSPSARRALKELLTDVGYRVETAVDGLDAIDRLSDVAPDVVLVDLEMPRMNGLELTSHLRSSESWRSLPIVMITSRATAKHKQQAVAAGVTTYLTKPYSEDDLVDELHALVAP